MVEKRHEGRRFPGAFFQQICDPEIFPAEWKKIIPPDTIDVQVQVVFENFFLSMLQNLQNTLQNKVAKWFERSSQRTKDTTKMNVKSPWKLCCKIRQFVAQLCSSRVNEMSGKKVDSPGLFYNPTPIKRWPAMPVLQIYLRKLHWPAENERRTKWKDEHLHEKTWDLEYFC